MYLQSCVKSLQTTLGPPIKTREVAIESQLSATYYTTMSRSFGTDISANRGRGFELTLAQRTNLISKREEGLTVRELMAEFKCGRNAIYDTLNRWKNHGTIESLPRAGRPKALTHREQRALFRAARKKSKDYLR